VEQLIETITTRKSALIRKQRVDIINPLFETPIPDPETFSMDLQRVTSSMISQSFDRVNFCDRNRKGCCPFTRRLSGVHGPDQNLAQTKNMFRTEDSDSSLCITR
jgi:hypothetical protein